MLEKQIKAVGDAAFAGAQLKSRASAGYPRGGFRSWLDNFRPLPQIDGPWLALLLALLTTGIFVIDLDSPRPVGVLYVVVIFISASPARRGWVISTSVVSIVLTLLSYFLVQPDAVRCVIRIVAIGVVTSLILRNLATSKLLREQARLLDQTHDSVSVRDLNGIITSWNRGASQLYGWSIEEAQGSVSQELLKTELPMSQEELIQVLRRKGYWEGEAVNRARDGKQIWVQSRCSLLLDERLRPKGILETSNDISHRHETDKAIRRNEKRYRTIFETTGVSIFECNISAVRRRIMRVTRAGKSDFRDYLKNNPGFVREAIHLTRAVDANLASVRMFDASSKDDLLGPLSRFWTAEGESAFAEVMIATYENRPVFETEAVLRTMIDRRLKTVFTTAFPGETVSRETMFISIVDVTEFNRARVALQSAQSDLAYATRLTSLGQLTASIAHEVNQPLAAILASGQAALRWLRRDEPQIGSAVASLERIVSDAGRAGDVIGGVRALARNEAPQQTALDLNGVIRDSLRLLGTELERCDVELVLDLDESLPEVRADRIQTQQVVINLTMNAIQAMNSPAIARRQLCITSTPLDHVARVTISDSGPGIAVTVRERLFKPFTTTKHEGMGLGLSICAAIMSRQDGTISADCDKPVGASFTFTLPVQSEPA